MYNNIFARSTPRSRGCENNGPRDAKQKIVSDRHFHLLPLGCSAQRSSIPTSGSDRESWIGFGLKNDKWLGNCQPICATKSNQVLI